MMSLTDLIRETRFLAKQGYVVGFLLVVFALTSFAIVSGVNEIREQQETLVRLQAKDATEREHILAEQHDYGSAAYYSFHLTYSEPQPLAFAAMGQRDVTSWKHRIRMLALEGQIYETDAQNPELSLAGFFDFAFIVSILLPLFVILLLHDLRAGEREAGRYDLLLVSAKRQGSLWAARALILCTGLALALLVPFGLGAWTMAVPITQALAVMAIVLVHLAFWAWLTLLIGKTLTQKGQRSARIASALLGIWLASTVVVPVVSDSVINHTITGPSGGDIVLLQREEVNGAWDKPFSDTWASFLTTHPEWAQATDMQSLFEWKWYYAFQQVGDQKAAPLSQAYRQTLRERDAAAGYAAWLSPSTLTQRWMTSLANTDVKASMRYEQRVRDFHQSLRQFYYPLLFGDAPFSHDELEAMPVFSDEG
ncbi:DUF3526 domain-containing protein [Vibrio cholerae]